MKPFVPLICLEHRLPLFLTPDAAFYACSSGCQYEIKDQIPRFVPLENYASSFGLQWKTFRKTQLDSYTRLPVSRDRLARIVGGSLEIFRGRNVLEAGCGAGRFTEVMLEAGANVLAVDISTAVDANFQNCRRYPNYYVCQADILAIPVPPGQFDIVVCIGVVQHTPDPEQTIGVLCSHVKPGGLLFIDHYTYGYEVTAVRRRMREFLLKRDRRFSLRFVQFLTTALWPMHVVFNRLRSIRGFGKIRRAFLSWSPIVDYHDAYPSLGSKLLYQWAFLDTHDTLTDYYKHLRSAEEIRDSLSSYDMINVQVEYAGNGVEARAQKPPNSTIEEK